MLTLTCPIETRWHPVPAGAKLIGLAVATLLVVALRTPLAVSAGLVVAVLVYLAEGVGFARHGLRMLRPLWPFVAVLAIWHGVTGALADGVVIGARMLTAVALANLVTMTTRLDDMIAVVERAAQPLARLGLAPRTLAVAIALMVRFTPVLFEKYGRLGDAWKARCARRANWRLVLPGLLVALDDADHVAEALRARGGL
jgi:biotin transport system permease protein